MCEEDNLNCFLLLSKGHCDEVPLHTVQKNSEQSHPESNSDEKKTAREEYKNNVTICNIIPPSIQVPSFIFRCSGTS